MKANKSGKVLSPAPSSSGTDTSRWEALLSGGGKHKDPSLTSINSVVRGSGVVLAALKSKQSNPTAVDHRTALGRSGSASQSDKLPVRKREKGNQSSGLKAASNGSAGPSNWQTLLTGAPKNGMSKASIATSASSIVGSASATDKSKKKKQKKKKRPRAEGSQASDAVPELSASKLVATSDLSPSSLPNGAMSTQSNDVFASGINKGGGSSAGKKRKRSGTDGHREGAPITGAIDARVNGETHRSQNKSALAVADAGHSKRPRSNVLNLAFEAQKAASIAGEAHEKDSEQGRGRAKGGKRGKGGAEKELTPAEKAQYVGLDCEMVGVGPGGRRSVLARCCMVDWEGSVIYDKHVVPKERVTDFRTFVSGVKAKHLKDGLPLRQCQNEVAAILKNKVLVGHALTNDFKALMMSHPPRMTRDTATYRPYQKAHGKAGGKLRSKSLKSLAEEHLAQTIQSGQHHPAEDARAAMDLYKLGRFEWEKSVAAASKMRGRRAVVDQQGP